MSVLGKTRRTKKGNGERTRPELKGYLIHRPTGQAYIRLPDRSCRYFGKADDPATMQRYRDFMAEWTRTGAIPAPVARRGGAAPSALTVGGLAERFEKDPGNLPVGGYMRLALRELKERHGLTVLDEFGPKRLRNMLNDMAQRSVTRPDGTTKARYTRGTINQTLQAVKAVWRWGVAEELAPAVLWQTLKAVPGIKAGRTAAREPRKVRPVPVAAMEETLKHLPDALQAVVRLLDLTGARPSELLSLTPGMIDRTGDVWCAALEHHKNAGKGKMRTLFFGPLAQDILRPLLLRPDDAPLFNPREALAQRHAACGFHRPAGMKPNPTRTDRKVGDRYDAVALARAIRRVNAAAGIAPWTPYALRHGAATRARGVAGLDGAQVLLGHSHANITEVYAELDADKARELARKIG